jgi:hypothetical protein
MGPRKFSIDTNALRPKIAIEMLESVLLLQDSHCASNKVPRDYLVFCTFSALAGWCQGTPISTLNVEQIFFTQNAQSRSALIRH